ncbi:MAG: MurR/RpiR family transcriptional regulator [Micrococcaceae bacterium]
MSVLNNMENLKSGFSNTDLKLMNYIMENLEEIPTMTSSVLGKNSGTSAAAAIRFSKKLGFNKYSNFKIALSKDIENLIIHNEYSTISADDPFQTAKNKLIHSGKTIIDTTGDILNEEKINEAVDILGEAKNIYVYGAGSSSLAAEDIKQKWTRLGKAVIFDKDPYTLSQQMVHDEDTKVFWGISNSGVNRIVTQLVKRAKENEIPTIGISQLGSNKLSKKVDTAIQTASTTEIDNGHYGSGATHSILAQLTAIDVIFYFYLVKKANL